MPPTKEEQQTIVNYFEKSKLEIFDKLMNDPQNPNNHHLQQLTAFLTSKGLNAAQSTVISHLQYMKNQYLHVRGALNDGYWQQAINVDPLVLGDCPYFNRLEALFEQLDHIPTPPQDPPVELPDNEATRKRRMSDATTVEMEFDTDEYHNNEYKQQRLDLERHIFDQRVKLEREIRLARRAAFAPLQQTFYTAINGLHQAGNWQAMAELACRFSNAIDRLS